MLILTEFLTEKEDAAGGPLKDPASYPMLKLMHRAGIKPTKTYPVIPRVTGLNRLLGNKASTAAGLPMVAHNRWLKAEYAPYIEQLRQLIENMKPNLILCLGTLPAAILLGDHRINRLRGYVTEGRWGTKVLATYSPRDLITDYKQWPVVLADLQKARHETQFPEIKIPRKAIHIEPTLKDIRNYIDTKLRHAEYLSIDIETAGDQITCFGVSPNPEEAMVIPFFAHNYPDQAYWPDLDQELEAWKMVREICALPVPSIGQNFMYDMTFLWTNYKIPVPHFRHDTMLQHHSYQPEMLKGLGFQASIHLNEPSWKHMRANVGTHKDGDEE